jgi:hypothetical protein
MILMKKKLKVIIFLLSYCHRDSLLLKKKISLDSLLKQDLTNVSFMTNKIELLTNSLSDPDFIGTSINGKLVVHICYFYIIVIYLISVIYVFLFYFLETDSSQQENLLEDDENLNLSINANSSIENGSTNNNHCNM